MAGKNNNSDERLEDARELVACLEKGDSVRADEILQKFVDYQETDLFQEIGRLTRELHEAINSFLMDSRLTDLAQYDIPDATQRLKHVINLTEQAAHKTLTAVEESLPLVEGLEKGAGELSEEWDRFRARRIRIDEFRDLSVQLTEFFGMANKSSTELHGKLSDVLMAQEYQDLTGQIIRKVITLVGDVEDKLVQLIRISGRKVPDNTIKVHDKNKLEGPVVPGVDTGDVVTGQDDVDELLSSLGF